MIRAHHLRRTLSRPRNDTAPCDHRRARRPDGFLTYAEILASALLIGGALVCEGLASGDRVALVVPEVSGFLGAFFGLAAAGLVPVPLVPPTQAGDVPTFARQTRQLLRASRAAAVITTADLAPLLDVSDLSPAPRVLTLEALAGGRPLLAPVTRTLDDIALLQFTSGSTAAPKGVILTHASLPRTSRPLPALTD